MRVFLHYRRRVVYPLHFLRAHVRDDCGLSWKMANLMREASKCRQSSRRACMQSWTASRLRNGCETKRTCDICSLESAKNLSKESSEGRPRIMESSHTSASQPGGGTGGESGERVRVKGGAGVDVGRNTGDCGRVGIKNIAVVNNLEHQIIGSTATLPIGDVTKPPFSEENGR